MAEDEPKPSPLSMPLVLDRDLTKQMRLRVESLTQRGQKRQDGEKLLRPSESVYRIDFIQQHRLQFERWDVVLDQPGKVTITGTEKDCTVTGDGFAYRFENGMLTSLKRGETEYLLSGFRPNYYRALTDNDIDYFNFAPPLQFASPHYAWKRATDNARSKATFIHQFSHGALIETAVSVSGL